MKKLLLILITLATVGALTAMERRIVKEFPDDYKKKLGKCIDQNAPKDKRKTLKKFLEHTETSPKIMLEGLREILEDADTQDKLILCLGLTKTKKEE